MLYVQIFSDDFSLNLKFRKQEKLIVRGVNPPSWEYRENFDKSMKLCTGVDYYVLLQKGKRLTCG